MNTAPEPPGRAAEAGTSLGADPVQRWRLVVRRDPIPADLAQRDQLAGWEAALTASGLPVAGLDASRPKARLAIAAPLGAAVSGEAELLDVWLTQRLPRWRVREVLEGCLPAGFTLIDLQDVWLGEASLPGRVTASIYRAELPLPASPVDLAQAADSLLAAAALPRERRRGDAVITYDLRPFLADLAVEAAPTGGATIRMTLRHDPARGIGRPEEALAALAAVLESGPLVPTSLARERLVLAELPSEPAMQRPPRRLPARDAGRGPGPRPRAAG